MSLGVSAVPGGQRTWLRREHDPSTFRNALPESYAVFEVLVYSIEIEKYSQCRNSQIYS